MLILQKKQGALIFGGGMYEYTDDFSSYNSFFWSQNIGAVPNTIEYLPTEQKMEMTLSSSAAVGGVSFRPKYLPDGDFNIQGKFDAIDWPQPHDNLQTGIQLFFDDSRWFNIQIVYDTATFLNAVTTWSHDGGDTWTSATSDNYDTNRQIELRVELVGTTLTSYYRKIADGPGAAWNTASTVTVGSTQLSYISFFAYSTSPVLADSSSYLDDVVITSELPFQAA